MALFLFKVKHGKLQLQIRRQADESEAIRMKFDWRYAFHSFWLLMAATVLLSTVAVTEHHALRVALCIVLAFGVIDLLWTWEYPYFSRFSRQGSSALINLALFVMVAFVAVKIGRGWSPKEWGLLSFSLASIAGTIDGYLARPTKIQLMQTRQQLRKKAEILRNSLR